MRSIQRDLVLRLLAVVIALSAASSAGLYFYVRSRLSSEFEHGLRTRAQMVAGMVSWEDGKLEFNGPEPEFFGSSARAHAGEFEIWNADGSVFVRSTSLKDRDLPRLAASDRIYKVGLKDSPNARAFAHDFIPHEDIDATHPQPPPPLMT